MKFGPVKTENTIGCILAHSLRLNDDTRLKKGVVLSAKDAEQLHENGIENVVVAQPDKTDVLEDDAARAIAEALKTDGIDVAIAGTGRVNLYANCNGVLRANCTLVDQLNEIDPAITLASLDDLAPVETGRMIATVKIIPYAVDRQKVEAAIKISNNKPFGISHYSAMRVGLIATTLPSLKPSVMDKTLRVLKSRLAVSKSLITREIRCAHDANKVSNAIKEQLVGNDLLILFGASAISDIKDVLPAAIEFAGGKVTRFGMPVDPGNLLLLGEIEGKPIIGAPGCARSPAENGFDWVLDRTIAGIEITSKDISGLGVGGLLMEIGSRPRPREMVDMAKFEVAAIILAAGQSRRMGKANKLLAVLNGQTLIEHVSKAALSSSASATIMVTGHEADRVSKTVNSNITKVHNADYAIGLSSSLATGIAAVPETSSHAIMLLGDMPEIGAGMIDQMIEAAKTSLPNAIIMASNNGKRGNPVLWPRAYFEALKSIAGDVGARHLIEANREQVVEVELGEAASFDLDTPEALKNAGGSLS